MINSFSVAGAGAGATATAAITLHFNYNNNNNESSKIVPAATNEHKSHNLINSAAPVAATAAVTTAAASNTAKMFKITQNEVETKHYLMSYPQPQQNQQQQPQQQQKQQKRTAVLILPGKANTSAKTKDSQLKHVNLQPNNNTQQKLQSTKPATATPEAATTTTTGAMLTTKALAESVLDGWTMPQQQRTEDQENAFRQIEDVHNYAKLQHQQHHRSHNRRHFHHHHQHSSSSDELGEEYDDDDDDEEDDVDEEEEENAVKLLAMQKIIKQNHINVPKNLIDDEEHVEVDVVTVTPTATSSAVAVTAATGGESKQLQQEQELMSKVDQDNMRPEHHARRPMNAFLIFCKRHRAIVKERYKTLENRAITKILGDWWAALEEHEKQCFTDLAQQNKDAFFNANPNFKWYKLPAPPLRTLATRPSNAAAGHPSEEQQQQAHQHLTQQQHQQQHQQQQQQQQQHWPPNEVAHMLRRNLFKFADETQMGELSALLSGNAGNAQDKEYALQQALSETTQYMSAHMPSNNSSSCSSSNKRSVDSASNSSEEEERCGTPTKKMKTSRSCKGKIYQQLFNSGQLAATAKKSKCRLNSGGSGSSSNVDANSNTPPISPTSGAAGATAGDQLQLDPATRTSSRPSQCNANEFDLEEKIKELPALSLDAYLQRKRSIKKKKKFSSSKKQRNSSSNSSSTTVATATAVASAAAAATVAAAVAPPASGVVTVATACSTATTTAAIAVGSQKRKARKESITRRDVSAMEQEVASILPLTINGCYHFNQTPRVHPMATHAAAEQVAVSAAATATVAASPFSLSSSSTLSAYEQVGYDVTTTSDLLILAEVAANRTEMTKSN